MNAKRLSLLALVALGFFGIWKGLRGMNHAGETAPVVQPVAPVPIATDAPATTAPPALPPPTAPQDAAPTKPAALDPGPAPRPSPRVHALTEVEIMERLHALGASQPVESLTLAREGNRRFKSSADAPERASIIVKSLSSLGRHDEARAEGLKMEKDYPNSDWTHDVHHHMFVNPPTHPTERGFGKTHEGD
jgi:hypothetical protein